MIYFVFYGYCILVFSLLRRITDAQIFRFESEQITIEWKFTDIFSSPRWETRFKIALRLNILAPCLNDKLLLYLSSLHLKNLSLVFLEDILLCICFLHNFVFKRNPNKLIVYNFLFHLYENQLIWCIRRTPSKPELFFAFCCFPHRVS